jgi:two-component system chemotaxis response regulator CheB
VVCIGASAGGLNAVSELIAQLPADINAAIFVVLHLSRAAMGDVLVSRL